MVPGAESNHRHADQSAALPTELPGRAPGTEKRSGRVDRRPAKRRLNSNRGGVSGPAPSASLLLALLACAGRGGAPVLFLGGFLGGNAIRFAEPAAEIDVGAALRTERAPVCAGGLAANRARTWRTARGGGGSGAHPPLPTPGAGASTRKPWAGSASDAIRRNLPPSLLSTSAVAAARGPRSAFATGGATASVGIVAGPRRASASTCRKASPPAQRAETTRPRPPHVAHAPASRSANEGPRRSRLSSASPRRVQPPIR